MGKQFVGVSEKQRDTEILQMMITVLRLCWPLLAQITMMSMLSDLLAHVVRRQNHLPQVPEDLGNTNTTGKQHLPVAGICKEARTKSLASAALFRTLPQQETQISVVYQGHSHIGVSILWWIPIAVGLSNIQNPWGYPP